MSDDDGQVLFCEIIDLFEGRPVTKSQRIGCAMTLTAYFADCLRDLHINGQALADKAVCIEFVDNMVAAEGKKDG